MNTTNPNEPAFQVSTYPDPEVMQQTENGPKPVYKTTYGLTKREHIATEAMAALLSCPGSVMGNSSLITPEQIAEAAVLHADALIAQLNKPVQ